MVEVGVVGVHSLDQLLGMQDVSGKTIASPLCGWETGSAEVGWRGWEERTGFKKKKEKEKRGQALETGEPGWMGWGWV